MNGEIGSMELIVILIVAMLAIGPGACPKRRWARRSLVQKIHERRDERSARASDEFREVTDEIADAQKTMRKAFKDADDEISGTKSGR
ncbi:MAG: hypothetical protein ACLTBF_01230 [Christensenellales bacterium]